MYLKGLVQSFKQFALKVTPLVRKQLEQVAKSREELVNGRFRSNLRFL